MWKILFITFLIITLAEGIYLWIKWDKIQSLITAMKTLNKMMDITKMIGLSTHPAVNKKKFIVKVATFIGNYIEHTWLWVTIILIMNFAFSLLFSAILSLLILIVNSL